MFTCSSHLFACFYLIFFTLSWVIIKHQNCKRSCYFLEILWCVFCLFVGALAMSVKKIQIKWFWRSLNKLFTHWRTTSDNNIIIVCSSDASGQLPYEKVVDNFDAEYEVMLLQASSCPLRVFLLSIEIVPLFLINFFNSGSESK